ncbi:serine/arginine-rich splicing factor RS40-like isoform X2 [Prosopis cineraria]|nr:serine/arginine-rich splicing factor RS40-like isoform X2 [Prosopis cineraria]XP_054787352.1 serine/arginine-rich splicing factor RS40-like isoform X2 [Prosopis cineraria]XP_054787353.1 serine/arginine-rich splicing factor RS40-like isoform X2 [Prosopis cineraria]
MEDERDAEDAIRALDRAEFGRKGRRLRVEWTKHERGIRRPGSSRRSSANSRPSKTLFVINFDTYHTRTRDLERHFEPYGKIVSVRIRRNFAFVQYESCDDAIRALEATNMSKLLDRVITVEYAVENDDDRRNAHSPDRSHDRPRDISYDRKRSPSPYHRERGSPDYGRGSSPYRRERSSPDYGHSRSRSSQQIERGSPDYNQRSRSPYGRERDGSDPVHGSSHSPHHKERARSDRGNSHSHSPNGRERVSPQNGSSDHSPLYAKRASPENGHGSISSPDARGDGSPYNGDEGDQSSMPEPKDNTIDGAPESPMNETYRSHSPAAEE